jgi:aspartate/methionine/tyrosine aminotransferase
MIGISKMAAAVQPSATLAAGARARQMKAEGVNVFDFSLGEPDFLTPEHIRAAAVAAMNKGQTRYTAANGTPELRLAVSRFYEKTYGIRYSAEQVLISNGAKHSIHNALAALVGPGDEVIIPILSDEIYEKLVFGDAQATCFATLRPGLPERTITISGASKTYAMTGWRVGWALGPAHAIKAMGNVQSQQSGCPCSVSQAAALAALAGDQACVEEMRQEFQARRDLVCARLAKMPGVKPFRPDGAFYAFFDVSAHFGRTLGGRVVNDSVSFCLSALESGHVNVVPGAAFGAEGFVRLSYAASREQLQGGLERLEKFLR